MDITQLQSPSSGAEFTKPYYEPVPYFCCSNVEPTSPAPADFQSIPAYEPPRLSHMDITQLQSPSSGAEFTKPYYEPVPQPRRLHIVACMCPNCVNGINSKATNTDGSPKKKQHNCQYAGCEKSYMRASYLRDYLCWHTGERPFVCKWPFCRKRFIRSNDLKRHERIHTGEEHFVCVECNRRFLRSELSQKAHSETA